MSAAQHHYAWITTQQAIEISKEYLGTPYSSEYLRQLLRAKHSPIQSRKFGNQWAISEDSWRQYLKNAVDSIDQRRGAKPK